MAAAVEHQWKKGSAELLILSLLEDQPRHGYEIGRLIDMRSLGALHFHVASLCPLLYRLENGAGSKGAESKKQIKDGAATTA
jgi:DNA-binding PadR family transcriptional regulator